MPISAQKYDIKIKGITEEDLISARKFVKTAEDYPNKLIELPFIIESDTLEGRIEGQYRVHDIHDLEPGTELNYVLDVAKESFDDEKIKSIFMNARIGFC